MQNPIHSAVCISQGVVCTAFIMASVLLVASLFSSSVTVDSAPAEPNRLNALEMAMDSAGFSDNDRPFRTSAQAVDSLEELIHEIRLARAMGIPIQKKAFNLKRFTGDGRDTDNRIRMLLNSARAASINPSGPGRR